MFYGPGLVFGGMEGVRSRFNVLRARKRGCGVPFSCFALPKSFPEVPRASVPVFMFCAPELIFGGTEGVWSRLHVLRSRTCFRRCCMRRVTFTCFARPYSFSAVLRAIGPIFMFCMPGLDFGGMNGVRSPFHVLCSLTCFWQYGGCQVPFSCFARLDKFSAETRVLGPVFMFFALGLVFGAMECVRTRFPVLRARTHFRWYRGRLFPFSCFTRLDSFSAVPRASVSFFMFCAPGHFFGGAECVGSHFHVLRAQTGFGDPEGDVSRFHVLRASSSFQRHRGRRVPFSYFALPDTF
jgi:hypothetical protein